MYNVKNDKIFSLSNFKVGQGEEIEVESECVVRLTTSYWHDNKGSYTKRSLKYLQRKCKGYNILDGDCDMIGVEDVLTKIINLDDCEDGIYWVDTCDESYDWETGYIDDYSYQLIPYNK